MRTVQCPECCSVNIVVSWSHEPAESGSAICTCVDCRRRFWTLILADKAAS
jgi:hypothetical protein